MPGPGTCPEGGPGGCAGAGPGLAGRVRPALGALGNSPSLCALCPSAASVPPCAVIPAPPVSPVLSPQPHTALTALLLRAALPPAPTPALPQPRLLGHLPCPTGDRSLSSPPGTCLNPAPVTPQPPPPSPSGALGSRLPGFAAWPAGGSAPAVPFVPELPGCSWPSPGSAPGEFSVAWPPAKVSRCLREAQTKGCCRPTL